MPLPIVSSSAMSRQRCRSSKRLAWRTAATTDASHWKDRRDVPNSSRCAVSYASGRVRQSYSTWHGKVSDVARWWYGAVAHDRAQASGGSQGLDFPSHDWRILPHTGPWATESLGGRLTESL